MTVGKQFFPGLLVALCACSTLQAQRETLSAERCAIAAEIVRTGDSPRYSQAVTGYPAEYKQRWAYSWIRQCGSQGGTALAYRVRLSRTSSDTTWLKLVTNPARYLLDRDLFNAALDVAVDPAATVEARVFAVRSAIWAIEPRLSLSYLGLASGRCAEGVTLDVEAARGTPILENKRNRLMSFAARVANEASLPVQVRSAVACAVREASRPDSR